MPPTFLLILGFLLYVVGSAVSIVVFAPMLLIRSKRTLAQKVLATALISFPCLVVVLIVAGLIFLIPGLCYYWLSTKHYLPETVGVILGLIGLAAFGGIVMITSLYLWYFASKVIYQRIDGKPISEFMNKDKAYKFVRLVFAKLISVR